MKICLDTRLKVALFNAGKPRGLHMMLGDTVELRHLRPEDLHGDEKESEQEKGRENKA